MAHPPHDRAQCIRCHCRRSKKVQCVDRESLSSACARQSCGRSHAWNRTRGARIFQEMRWWRGLHVGKRQGIDSPKDEVTRTKENHMRPSLMGSIIGTLIVLGLGLSPATARSATQLEEHNSYAGCFCSFGYGTNSCSDAVSCQSEGGRCTRACTIPRQ